MTALSGFRAFGLTIASEFDIPGAIQLTHADANADIVIREGNSAIGLAEAVNGPYTRNGKALLFDAMGVARYLASTPQQLFIEPYEGADPDYICKLLIATALPMMLWMRGGVVMHAAGIIPAGTDRAIAIAGPSGIGKSTLALRFMDLGARLVGDDSLWLTLSDGKPAVRGLTGMAFQSNEPGGPRTDFNIPPQSQVEEARLGAIITLRTTNSETPEAPQRLHGVAAIEALLRNRHRPKIPAILGLEAALLPQCILHCQTLPIYEIPVRYGDAAGLQQQIASIISDHFGSA